MCPRPKRRKIKFDEESVNNLLQEIYDDSHNIRAQIKRLYTKWETKVKEGGEIQAIGDQIVKLIASEAKNQDQKIMLLKFLKEVVFAKPTGAQDPEEEKKITTEKRNELISMVQEYKEKSDGKK